MRIVAYKTSLNGDQVLIEESTGEQVKSDRLDTLLSFLLEQFDEKDEPVQTIKVCWNLNDTVAPILRLVGRERCQKLHDTHKCFCRPFNIFYIPDKVFLVVHIPTRYKLDLYGIDQYYPELNNSRTVEEVEYLGLTLLNELHKMNLYPSKLTSPVAIYEQCVMSHLDLPAVTDMPKEAAEMAWMCSGKLWIEAHQLGYWE